MKKLIIWYINKRMSRFEKEISRIEKLDDSCGKSNALSYLGSKSYYRDMIDNLKRSIDIIKKY